MYAVLGDEALLVKRAEDALVKRALEGVLPSFNFSAWRGSDEGAVELPAVARTLPMMSKRRVLQLRDVHEGSLEMLQGLLAHVEADIDTAVVVVSGTGWPKVSDKKLAKKLEAAISKRGAVLKIRSRDQDPVEFSIETASELGVRLERRQARLLVGLVGTDLGTLRRELEKAALYKGGDGVLTDDDLQDVCSMLADARIWDLTDAVVARDAAKALEASHRMLEAGKRGEEFAVLSRVVWQMRQLLALQASMHGGPDPGMRMPDWKRRKLESALQRSPLDPVRVMHLLADADHKMKSHKAGSRRIFEGLLLQLVSR